VVAAHRLKLALHNHFTRLGSIFARITMRIEKLYYRNHVTGWELATMEFGDVNLLVGVSGVGKTKILEVIRSLQKIAFGSPWYHHSTNGIEWDITFYTSLESQYKWCGKFSEITNSEYLIDEPNESTHLRTAQNDPLIELEELYVNGECIASRSNGIIKFENKTMPKLSPSESLIKIFWSEDKIIPIINDWRLVVDSQAQHSKKWLRSYEQQIVKVLSTERKIYPSWLSCLLPELERVKNPSQVQTNNYYLISGGGYPSLYEEVEAAVENININQNITISSFVRMLRKIVSSICNRKFVIISLKMN
jgi:predicted ATP-dependent endonuclease of OLD family